MTAFYLLVFIYSLNSIKIKSVCNLLVKYFKNKEYHCIIHLGDAWDAGHKYSIVFRHWESFAQRKIDRKRS